MGEIERNKRLFKLTAKLMQEEDLESLQLLETFLVNDTKSMRKSFEIVIQRKLDWLIPFCGGSGCEVK